MFNALYLSKENAQFSARIAQLSEDDLTQHAHAGDTVVRVLYSTLNYKDGLAICNKSPVVRTWPMVAGIDCVGMVEHINAGTATPLKVGDTVVLNGFGVGETHWGGLAQRARLKAEWLIALPSGITPQHAMAIGTAGYTAMLSVMALEQQGVSPDQGEILVTGASGGVGSVAVALLAQLGFKVVASTGKLAESAYLQALGAHEVIDRATLSNVGKPLQKERFAGVVDSVGSHTLVNACAQLRYGGTATACGLAQGLDFPASVAPFILRGVKLIGIDSVMAPRVLREAAWARLARDLNMEKLATISHEIGLQEALTVAPQILAGQVRGRVVVDVNR